MSDVSLPARLLYRFVLPCRYCAKPWPAGGAVLEERYRLAGLGELENRPEWAEVRAAWNRQGLAFAVRVQGKRQPPWRAAGRPEESDGLQVWIDTRDVHNVHRAGRFCHRFAFLPGSEGDWSENSPLPLGEGQGVRANSSKDRPHPNPLRAPRSGRGEGISPLAEPLPIHRAKEPARPVARGLLKVRSKKQTDGYLLEAFVPAEALLGFDPAEHPRLGFTYAVSDRELGRQTLTVGSPLPYQEDPSLWATLELTGSDA
ncbi:MAG: hypothetical protein JXB10_17990 [Pirellulales bacterium]|nr:hypothetical protein [Pirellulales bacterium]